MKKMKKIGVLILLILFSAPYLAVAQNPSSSTVEEIQSSEVLSYKLDKYNSVFKIKGTSTLHDWEMISKTFDGKIVIERTGADNFKIKDILISIKVTTLESDNRIMNKKTYEALKEEDHPFIKYNFIKVKEIKETGEDQFEAIVNGNLTIAGVKKAVDINLKLDINDKKMNIIGHKPLKMSDFDVEPPKALMGTIKTGNDIDIEFNLNYEHNLNFL